MSEHLVKAALKSDLSETGIKGVEVEGLKIVICKVNDSFYAIGDICTHAKVSLHGGQLIGDQIECPKHGARFDVKTGQAVCLPAVTAEPTYRVDVKGEELWIAIPE